MSKTSGRLDPLKHDAGYAKIGDLGTGAFGSVILYTRKLADGQDERVAVKAIARNEYIDYKLVGREVSTESCMTHLSCYLCSWLVVPSSLSCIPSPNHSGGPLINQSANAPGIEHLRCFLMRCMKQQQRGLTAGQERVTLGLSKSSAWSTSGNGRSQRNVGPTHAVSAL